MVSFYCLMLYATIFLFYLIHSGVSSIRCYTCDSITNEACNDPFNETLFVPVTCENENFACIKMDKIKKGVNRTYLHRGCVQRHFCEVLSKAVDFCSSCTYDICNSSPALIPSIVTVSLLTVNCIIYKHL